MARIAGVDLPQNKQIWIGLTYIHGVGRARSKKLSPDELQGGTFTVSRTRAATGTSSASRSSTSRRSGSCGWARS